MAMPASSSSTSVEQISNDTTQVSNLTPQLVEEVQTLSDIPLASPVNEVSSSVTAQLQEPANDQKFIGAPMGDGTCIVATTTPQSGKNNGNAVASLVCAIIGLLFYFSGLLFYFSGLFFYFYHVYIPLFGMILFPFAICLALLAIHEMKQQSDNIIMSKCMAISGLVLGILGFLLSIFFIIVIFMSIFEFKNKTPE